MPIVTMPLSEALEKGYDIVGPAPVHRTEPPTTWESAVIIGTDVVPAILGGILGSFAGRPYVGAMGGGALGNYWSQIYRIGRGLQEDVSAAELATATAVSGIGGPALKGATAAARIAARTAQGAAIAPAELTARTLLERGELPTADQVSATILFGGVLGGGLGGLEAKWLSKTLGVDGIQPEMTRGDVVNKVTDAIKDEGLQNFQRVRPLAASVAHAPVHGGRPGTPADEAEKLIRSVETQLVRETEDAVSAVARRGEEATGQMATIGEAFDRQLAQESEIFKPIMRQAEIERKVEKGYGDFLVYQGKMEDRLALQAVREKIAAKDHQFGRGKGAKKERAAWAGEERRLLNKMGLGGLEEAMVGRQLARPMEPLPPGGAMLQRGPDQVLAKRISPLKDRPMEQAGEASKWEAMSQKLLGEDYHKFYSGILGTGTGGAALYVGLTDEEKDEMSRAGLGELARFAMMAGMGYGAFRKFRKTPQFKRVAPEIKRNPEATEPLTVKSARVEKTLDSPEIYPGESRTRTVLSDAKSILDDVLSPLSRKLKNIKPLIAAAFRRHETDVLTMTRSYLDRETPFITTMTKRLSHDDAWKFKNALLTPNEKVVKELAVKYKVPLAGKGSYAEMRQALDELRTYAREKGGIDVGYLEGYFPREIKNYKQFREWLDSTSGMQRTRNEIDRALDEYRASKGYRSDEPTPPAEAVEVAGRVLRGYQARPAEGASALTKPRVLDLDEMGLFLNAYADPADALAGYVRRVVNETETRAFLRPDLSAAPERTVGFPGSRQTIRGTPRTTDLGTALRVDDSLAGQIALRMGKEEGWGLSEAQLGELQRIIRRRFSGETMGAFMQGTKNLGYIQTMTSWGSAITQLGDNVFSIHFNGLGNTFESMVGKRFDFVKHFGLNRHDVDVATSSGGLNKVLDKMFTISGLKKLDQWGKNNFMNAAWRKYKKLSTSEKGTAELLDDLVPIFGAEHAQVILKDLRTTKVGGRPPASIAELIWYKFSDVSPASMTEIPYHGQGGNLRILYMLKSFTVKQFDAFRETAAGDISKAMKLYGEGKRDEAARIGARGAMNLAGLATVFVAANAGTDVIKDILYGRPIKADRLLQDNLWKLIGANRYLQYQSRRQGPARAVLEGLLPPTAVFDRAWKDISSIAGDDEYKGAMLQGTPLDMIYWRYLGGVEKSKRLERED